MDYDDQKIISVCDQDRQNEILSRNIHRIINNVHIEKIKYLNSR